MPHRKRRFTHFTLRSVLVVILVCSIFLGVGRSSSYLAAAGVVLSGVLSFAALSWRVKRLPYVIRPFLGLCALAILWLSVFDFSELATQCDHCGTWRSIQQYRVLGVPVMESVHDLEDSVLSRIAADLGRPCPHAYTLTHQRRWWGLLFCAYPCDDPVYLTSDTDPRWPQQWYDREAAATVREMGTKPGIGDKFYRALLEGDTAFQARLLEDLMSLVEDDEGCDRAKRNADTGRPGR